MISRFNDLVGLRPGTDWASCIGAVVEWTAARHALREHEQQLPWWHAGQGSERTGKTPSWVNEAPEL
jgi:hypothetical protein